MSLLHSGDELSLRHLPDVSDASFSFQIPGTSIAENLLADDTDFFRGGADVSLETIASPRKANNLLTLSQLTPRPTRNTDSSKKVPSSSTSSGTLQEPKSIKPTLLHVPNPRPSLIPTAPGPLVPSRELPAQMNLQPRGHSSSNRMSDASGSASIDQDMLAISERPKGDTKRTNETTQLHKREERRQKMTMRTKTRAIAVEPNFTMSRITTRSTSEVKLRDDNPLPSPVVISAFPISRLPGSLSPPDRDGFSVPDTSVQSVEATDRVTERLVKFGQRFMNPFSDNPSVRSTPTIRDAQNECEPPSVETGTDERDVPLEPEPETTNNTDDGPLTISQLSPRKCVSPTAAAAPTPSDNVPISPSRSSSKRPVSDASNRHQGRGKRQKLDTSAAQPASSSTQPQEQRPRTRSVTRLPPKDRFSRSDTASQTRVATRVLRTTRSTSTTAPQAQTRSSIQKPDNTEATLPKPSRTGPAVSTSVTNNLKSQAYLRHKPSSSLKERKRPRLLSSEFRPAWADTNSSQPPTNATYHADRSDNKLRPQPDLPSGSLSRTSHSRSQRRYETVHPIPDFKALHAAHEASLANRKENIHPTKPIEIQWETDIRAKERQRFDEMIKEKEREQERIMDQQRKEREEQEAREIRELRMKAIPKANEVPEWYKDVPRKKDKGGSLDASGANSVRR